jgi:predicted enzyme related to lactoylglutathione lyase
MALDSTSMTIGVPVPDVEAGRDWYGRLFGREPDLVSAPGVYEWRAFAGAWVQVVAGRPAAGDTGTVLRLGVNDLATTVERFIELGGKLGARTEIPDVIVIQELRDPFGNRLSFYEESLDAVLDAFEEIEETDDADG